MAVTISKPTYLGNGNYEITVSSDLGGTPTFYWRVGGARYYQGPETTQVIYIAPGTAPVISVTDDAYGDDENELAGYAVVQVYIDETTTPAYAHLLFEQYVNAAWVTREKRFVSGAGYYRFQSGFLDDVTTHQFRVTPVGSNGNSGTAKTFTIYIVRNPDPPDVAWTYSNSTDKVTITAN